MTEQPDESVYITRDLWKTRALVAEAQTAERDRIIEAQKKALRALAARHGYTTDPYLET